MSVAIGVEDSILWSGSFGWGKQDNEYRSIFHEYPTDHNPSFSKNGRHLVKMYYLPQVKAGMQTYELSEVLDASVDMEMMAKEKI